MTVVFCYFRDPSVPCAECSHHIWEYLCSKQAGGGRDLCGAGEQELCGGREYV